ncbi:hypothetical protein LRAMOSA09105 [Lichtheimia ramosa]|uniref:Uncharacterized protein n=1 Tax=Lichtheimia ramosa TaxID=688394 RepID=A0A077WJ02_9FUNG|nr:hypothetical protein LRAMOSA09105 [Lichtheimia ramosa]
MSRSFTTTITDAGAESNTTVDTTLQKNMNKDVEKGDPWEDLRRVDSYMDAASIIEPPPSKMLDDIPDGGYGWVVAAAGFLSNFVVFGVSTIWGE